MKAFTFIAIVSLLVFAVACATSGKRYTPATKTMLDGNDWTTENLKIDIAGSYCYSDDKLNCDKYGRLYTWASAKEACEMLGKGWHLPTNGEWERMIGYYGGVKMDSVSDGTAAFKALVAGGESGFDIVFGGTRDPGGDYRRKEAHGFYWTSTETASNSAWFYNLGGARFVNRHNDGEKERAISVRCINRGR